MHFLFSFFAFFFLFSIFVLFILLFSKKEKGKIFPIHFYYFCKMGKKTYRAKWGRKKYLKIIRDTICVVSKKKKKKYDLINALVFPLTSVKKNNIITIRRLYALKLNKIKGLSSLKSLVLEIKKKQKAKKKKKKDKAFSITH